MARCRHENSPEPSAQTIHPRSRKMQVRTPGTAPAGAGACSLAPALWHLIGAEEVVVDVFLPLVAEERDDVLKGRVPCTELAGGDEVRTRTRAHEQPELAGQAAHLADRRVAVHRHYLIDDVPVPGENAEDEAVSDCGCRKPRPGHATRRYSLIRPPTRACFRTRYWSRLTGSGSGFSGAAPCRDRCGRC